MADAHTFASPDTARIAAFLDGIGIPVLAADLADGCFLPGIRIDRGRLLVDAAQMTYPGDLLHEAGHIAVMTPEQRSARSHYAGKNQGEEIVAILWSWAALTHLGLPPELVFHGVGYRNASRWFIGTFGSGIYPGLPLLQWMGMTLDADRARERSLPPFPHMIAWLRGEPEPLS